MDAGKTAGGRIRGETRLAMKKASENQKPEIIFAWNYLEWGGGQIYFLGIMRRALSLGYKVKAVMPRGSSEKLLGYLKKENVEVEFFDYPIDLSKAFNVWQKIRRRFRNARSHFALGRHLSKQDLSGKVLQIDVAPWAGFWLLRFLARRIQVFVTLHIALPPELQTSLARRKFHSLCNLQNFHLLASNEDMKRSLRSVVPEDFWQTIPVAYTGINTKEIKSVLSLPLEREKLLRKYELPSGKTFVFSLGNIIERKGFRILLEVAAALKREFPELFFVWLGDGEQRGEMQNLIRDFGLESSAKIVLPAEIGAQREDLLTLFRLADIYAHPSFAEGLPGALLEAMALGKPVVASNVNAIPEVLENRETGFLVEAGNVSGLANAIAELAGDADLRESLAIKGQIKVLKHFTEERCAGVTVDFYEKYLQKS